MSKENTDTKKPQPSPLNGVLRVAIQGYKGAFHDVAVRKYFGDHDIEVMEIDTFDKVVDMVKHREVHFGAMAIENTIYGMLMPNFNLLNRSNIFIDGEVYLRIKQNLIGWPGTRVEDLKEVYSHPIAIEQCRAYFKAYPHIKLIESVDTALSVREVKEKRIKTKGAIGSSLAADLYGLDILAPAIETNKKNFTRFLILEKKSKAAPEPGSNKASIILTVLDQVGSLHKVLSELAIRKANLTKIQSIPILGKPFEYAFWIDLVGEDQKHLNEAIDSVRSLSHEVKILGLYPKGKHYDH
ncbi:MAG: prephenate dehydratase [Saprospiraceae bacterium]|nr:prephenate dehydratase [Saprospiraceae bacterium]